MTFKQLVILKHEHGITAQWQSTDWSWMAIATYHQIEQEGKDIEGKNVKYKRWVLGNCSGPWTGLTEDGKGLTIIDGYEAERNNVSGSANLLLSLFNAYTGGKKAFESIWKAPSIGFDEFWPEDQPV